MFNVRDSMSDFGFSGPIGRPWWTILSRRRVLQGDFFPLKPPGQKSLIDLSRYQETVLNRKPMDCGRLLTPKCC